VNGRNWVLLGLIAVLLSCGLVLGNTRVLVIGSQGATVERDVREVVAAMERAGMASQADGSLRLLLDPLAEQLVKSIPQWAAEGSDGDLCILFFRGSLQGLDWVRDVLPLLKAGSPGKGFLLVLDPFEGDLDLGSASLDDLGLDFSTFQFWVSAGESQRSETLDDGASCFSRSLVEGLEGDADANGNGVLELGELVRFVETRVVELSSGRQVPLFVGKDDSWPVTVDFLVVGSALKKQLFQLRQEGKLQNTSLYNRFATVLSQVPITDSPSDSALRNFLVRFSKTATSKGLLPPAKVSWKEAFPPLPRSPWRRASLLEVTGCS